MADISAIFFILLIIGIAFPAMLTAWWLLFPNLIERAQSRVEKTPAQTFWFGLVIVIALTVPIVILFALPFGPAKSLAWILLGLSIAISSIGSAGIAAHIGSRLTRQSNVAALGAFVRGALILELTAFFPVIGWIFIWIPMLITAFGATAFSLLKWTPREKVQPAPTASSSAQVNSPVSNL